MPAYEKPPAWRVDVYFALIFYEIPSFSFIKRAFLSLLLFRAAQLHNICILFTSQIAGRKPFRLTLPRGKISFEEIDACLALSFIDNKKIYLI